MNKTTIYSIPLTDLLVQDKPSSTIRFESELESGPASKPAKFSNPAILERYWNDIYKLFIHRLTQFDISPRTTEEDQKKLKSLLDELIYVKTLIAKD